MNDIWFTSDPHYFHKKAIEYSKRPFETVEEMNTTLIANTNKLVAPQHKLYILGDLCWGYKHDIDTNIKWVCSQIKCKNIYIILGNHDTRIAKTPSLQKLFSWCGYQLEIKVNHQKIILNHCAMRVWFSSHRGSYCCVGHSHGNLKEARPDNFDGGLLLDCGVDLHDYKPISFEQVKSIMDWKQSQMIQAKTVYSPDHHTPRGDNEN